MKSSRTLRSGDDVPVWIVIVTHNSRELISDCLASIHANSWPSEIIVVDNDSTDATCDLVDRIAPQAYVIRENRNYGFSVACNRGMRVALHAGAELILQMNDDARLLPTTLGDLVRIARENPSFGALIPANLMYTGEEMDPVFAAELRRNGVRGGATGAEVVAVRRLPGAVLLTRADVLREWGGLDPLFFLDGAEYDFCQRIQAGGWKVGFTPTAGVRHEYYRRFTNPHRLPLRKHLDEFHSTGVCILKDPGSTISMAVVHLCANAFRRLIMSIATLNPRRALATGMGIVRIAADFATIIRRRKMSLSGCAPFLGLDGAADGEEHLPLAGNRNVQAAK